MSTLVPIHPFPARMAPELAGRALVETRPGDVVLDPMCGSGTVPRAASEAGLSCIGCDVDPLAVLMAQVWTTPVEGAKIVAAAERAIRLAKALPNELATKNQERDEETERFISYWFAAGQRQELGRLAAALLAQEGPERDATAVALSRIIISKEKMASLARDTSHSRPHKVAESNDFDVYGGFLRSAKYVAKRIHADRLRGRAKVLQLDARKLNELEDECVDLIITSPPYLNAIDYLRGHRLSLVWLGYTLERLRQIRSDSVGAERVLYSAEAKQEAIKFIVEGDDSAIEDRHRGWVARYAVDMNAMLSEVGRVIRPGGKVILILGNSFLRGAIIDNAGLIGAIAERQGLQLVGKHHRDIPARRRYLPPPSDGRSMLNSRMRRETVLSFCA